MAIPRLFGRIGRGIASAARRARDLIPGQNYGYSLISPVLSGIIVTPQTALTLSAWFAGVNVISTDVAKLPLGLCENLKGGGKAYASKDPRHRLLRRRPNPECNAVRYRQSQMGHALGWGNHYSEIVRDGWTGIPTELWPLHPGTIKPTRTEKGKALFYEDINTGKKWRPEDILHIAGLSFDGITGYSPTTNGRQAIGLGIAQEQFGAALFGNGARPGGILRTPKRLSQDAAKRLRESFENIHAGTLNAHRTAVLEEGLEWIETQISPEAAQFLTSRQFQVVEVARLLNIPPHKLQDYSQAHLANVEESNLDYVTSTLQGWLEAIEAELNSKLLFDDELDRYFFQHDMNALLRGNMAARSTYYLNRFGVGSITPNEIRAREGDNPIAEPNADTAYLQAQNVPLAMAGQAMAAKVAGDSKPPAKTRKRRRATRYNHNHGEDGKFSSGSAHEAKAGRLGDELADHEDPAGRLVEEYPRVLEADEDWEDNTRSEHGDLLDEQVEEVKDQKDTHKQEQKDKVQEHKDEVKDQADEQKEELKELDRDHREDLREKEREHKQDQKDFDREQKDELEEYDDDRETEREVWKQHDAGKDESAEDFNARLERERKEFLEEQAQARREFVAGQAEEIDALKKEQQDQKQDLSDTHFRNREDLKASHVEDLQGLTDWQEGERTQLLEGHREGRKDWVTGKALEAHDLEQELEPEESEESGS